MEKVSSNSDLSFNKNADSWDPRICRAFFSGYCPKGSECSSKHIQPIREIVCKQILLHGECKKGPLCAFIHEIIPEKLPECRNFSNDGICSNPDCKFKHVLNKKESKECAYYNMGFCDQGKFCKFKHVRRELCYDFLNNRCFNGDHCKKYHLKHIAEEYLNEALKKITPIVQEPVKVEHSNEICHRCMKMGHPSLKCPNF